MLLFILYASGATATNAPNIIVGIKPFYNICAQVMNSVGSPHLLLTNNASPHDYQLRPSDAKLIQSADLIIWGGAELEGYLIKPISTIDNRDLDLSKLSGLTLLPIRNSVNWEHDGCAHDHGHNCAHDHGHYDAHFWLDPDNAIVIANAIALRLSTIDPVNAKLYNKNAAEFAKKIKLQIVGWRKKLAPYKQDPYIVFHDAYQYFNKFFGLDGVGSITLNPEIPPSVQRIQQIQTLLETNHIRCIFREPQFNYKIIDTLIRGTKVHQGELDPLGQDADLGPNGYFVLMDNMIDNFITCCK